MSLYSTDFKAKVIKEINEVGSISSVSRKHKLPASTVHGWIKSSNKKPIYKSEIKNKTLKEENKRLKNKLEESQLELRILKDLLKKATILR